MRKAAAVAGSQKSGSQKFTRCFRELDVASQKHQKFGINWRNGSCTAGLIIPWLQTAPMEKRIFSEQTFASLLTNCLDH